VLRLCGELSGGRPFFDRPRQLGDATFDRRLIDARVADQERPVEKQRFASLTGGRNAWAQALRTLDELGHPDGDRVRAKISVPGARLPAVI